MRRLARLLPGVVLGVLVAGCGASLQSPPIHAPESFPEIVSQLGRFGIEASAWVAGDPGCDDPALAAALAATAIRFQAAGLDQGRPVPLRIYIFRNRDAWERRRGDVDRCIAQWAEDPASFEVVDRSPYVLAGPGPWPPEFEAAVRRALEEASGTGG